MVLNRSKKFMALGAVASLTYVLSDSSAFAAGFAIRNQSTSSAGTALAADTVNTSDASGIFANPAIMSELSGHHLSLNLNYTMPNIEAKNASLRSTLLQGAPHPRQGETSVDDVGSSVFIPSVFGVHQITDDIHIGWGVSVPYATNTEYSQDWAGRYHGIKTYLQTLELAVSGSYRINEMFNVALGLNAQRASGEFSSAVDLGMIGFVNPAIDSPEAAIGQLDAISRFKGDSTAFGLQLGFLAKPIEDLRIGFSFRSEIKHKAEGDMRFTASNANAEPLLAGLRQNPTFQDSDDAQLILTLPAVYSLGVAYDLSDFTLFGNVSYTGWSSFSEFTPEYNGVSNQTVLNWSDSVFVAIGGEYRLDEAISLRAGLAWDQGVTDDTHRTPRTPDNDRITLAVGGAYALNENVRFNLAYQKLFVETAKIDLSEANPQAPAALRGNLTADLEIDPHIFMLSAELSF